MTNKHSLPAQLGIKELQIKTKLKSLYMTKMVEK